MKSESDSGLVVSDSLQAHGLWPTRLLCPWDSPGKNTGVGGLSLLPGILPTQVTEPGSPALQADSLPSEPPGKPFINRPVLVSPLVLAWRLWDGRVQVQGGHETEQKSCSLWAVSGADGGRALTSAGPASPRPSSPRAREAQLTALHIRGLCV